MSLRCQKLRYMAHTCCLRSGRGRRSAWPLQSSIAFSRCRDPLKKYWPVGQVLATPTKRRRGQRNELSERRERRRRGISLPRSSTPKGSARAEAVNSRAMARRQRNIARETASSCDEKEEKRGGKGRNWLRKAREVRRFRVCTRDRLTMLRQAGASG